MKVAIVTGASRGIGSAIARVLARKGWRLVLAARNAAELSALAGELPEAIAVPTDITRPDEVRRLVAAASDRWGRVDALVNNAGVTHVSPFEQVSPEVFDQLMAVNVKGPFLCIQAVLPLMRAQGSGEILNVVSIAAKRVFPEWSAYCASKFALDGMGKALAEELKGTGIRVSALYPGATDSPLWDVVGPDIPRGGMMRPEAVAEAVAFMLDQPASARISELVLDPAAGDV
jgi:NAD(P)-dependent dehydrogenase (short-subunit alcohol dehydrogenase family)